ncbi:hypothetical protein Golomagni_05761, partial [Golovinomyces magnicellulatus]
LCGCNHSLPNPLTLAYTSASSKRHDGQDQETRATTSISAQTQTGFDYGFMFLQDQNIISTAIPHITDKFHSISDIGWYGSIYILTNCSFQLLMGKVYKFYPVKPIFLTGILVFEIGSAICGAAPNSKVFILGRAIAGLGGSGMFSGAMVIMFNTVPLQQRPMYQGGIGGVLAIGSVVGPLLGGTFTDKVTWRWCFYINLPVAAVAMLGVYFLLQLSNQKLDELEQGWRGKLKQFDPLGNLCFFPGVICLILALQWGGSKYSWNSVRIVLLLVISAVMFIIFIVIQFWKKENATIPPRLITHRSIAAAAVFSFFNGAGLITLTYYLPIWFQAIKNVTAIRSGIMLLPLMLSTVVGTITSGITISKTGYYTQFFWISSIMVPIGAGLISTFTPTTGPAKWIGYQIIAGLGVGFGMQQPMNVVQTVLGRSDIATATALVTFLRFLASAIFLPVAQNIFLNTLVGKLDNLPNVDSQAVSGAGATELRALASGHDLTILLSDYNAAINNVAYMVIATSAMTLLGTVFVEWNSLKKAAKKEHGGGEDVAVDKVAES